MFDKMKQMKQLYDMQKKLKAMKIEKSTGDGTIKVAVNGTQRLESLTIDPSWLAPEKRSKLENELMNLINNTLSDIQRETAAQAQDLMKDLKGMGLPGL